MTKKKPVVITITHHKPRPRKATKEGQDYSFTIDMPGAKKPVTNNQRYTRANGAQRAALSLCGAVRFVNTVTGRTEWRVEINGKQRPVVIAFRKASKR